MITVIVPAHNEGEVIAAGVRSLLDGAPDGSIEVLVVCNGCTDDTAARAREAGTGVRVLESSIPSKSQAINLGLQEARGDNVVVADADVRITGGDIVRLIEGMNARGALAAAPAVEMIYLPGTSWMVRAYYRFWMSLPYIQEGMMAAGVYALGPGGRERLGILPRVIADDGYVRTLFSGSERVEVPSAVSRVLAPLSTADLIKIKTRSRVGGYELAQRFPHLLRAETKDRDYLGAIVQVLTKPAMWAAVIPYLYINIVSRSRARRQARTLDAYRWERDDGSRRAFAQAVGARKD